MKRLLLALVLSSLAASAQDTLLAALRTTVLALREHPDEHREIRGATADLTVAKHQLRDWMETRLAKFAQDGNEIALAQELHNGLRDASMFCDDDFACNPSYMGFLDDFQVKRQGEFLIIQTGVGIWCGYDYSAYVYQWSGKQWERIWLNEQDTYTEKDYLPQILHAIRISPPDSAGSRLVLTVGSRPGCAAAFQPVYYRVWRMSADHRITLLIDRSQLSSIDSDPPIKGDVTVTDAMVVYLVGGTGYGWSHKAVRHFEIQGNTAKQVDPIALTPHDFVDEWLDAPWSSSAARSDSPSLQTSHDKLHRDDGQGDFPEPALRCTRGPDLWQAGTHLQDLPMTYYLVRWQEPYRFTMVGVSDKPYPDCTVRDPKGDERPNLFPDQN